jgi:hypothetical protein
MASLPVFEPLNHFFFVKGVFYERARQQILYIAARQIEQSGGPHELVEGQSPVRPKQAEDALHKHLDQAQKKVESQKQAVAKAKTSMQAWVDQKKAEAKATVESWKAGHEAKKLERRADRAEEYAAAAVEVAVASIDEAEQAVFEAIAARLDAEATPVGAK